MVWVSLMLKFYEANKKTWSLLPVIFFIVGDFCEEIKIMTVTTIGRWWWWERGITIKSDDEEIGAIQLNDEVAMG